MPPTNPQRRPWVGRFRRRKHLHPDFGFSSRSDAMAPSRGGEMRGKRQAPTSRWTITFGVTLIALGVLSFNAWASFSSAVATSHAVGSGTLVLDLTPNSQVNRLARAYDASDVAPGDTMQRALGLNSSATVAMSSVSLATT